MWMFRIGAPFLLMVVTRYNAFGQDLVPIYQWNFNGVNGWVAGPNRTPIRNPFRSFLRRQTTTPSPTLPPVDDIMLQWMLWSIVVRAWSRYRTDQTTQATSSVDKPTPSLLTDTPRDVVTNAPETSAPATENNSPETVTQQGYWLKWTGWSLCSALKCGEQSRTRVCAGTGCEGEDKETAECNVDANCLLTGTWSDWGPWGDFILESPACSGYNLRSRTCDDGCVGSSREKKDRSWLMTNRGCSCYILVEHPFSSRHGSGDYHCDQAVGGQLGAISSDSHYSWIVSTLRGLHQGESTIVRTDNRYNFANSMFDNTGLTTKWYDSPPTAGDGERVRVRIDSNDGYLVDTGNQNSDYYNCVFPDDEP